jgi:hypothetical protein
MYLRQSMLVLTTKVEKNGEHKIINQRHHNAMPHPVMPNYDSIEAALLDMWQPCSTDMTAEGYVTTFKRAAE